MDRHWKKDYLGLKRRDNYSHNNNEKKKIAKRNTKYNLNDELPIYKYADQIIDTINENQIVVLCGKTGCGKTTQVPQLIYNFCLKTNLPVKILVTQPRRIAAISISKRLCQELDEKLGEVVGYQVGMDMKYDPNKSKIIIKTTGIFFEELIHNPELDEYTHIILDEVHERDSNIDMVLLMLKAAIKERLNIKLILMSATISPQSFAEYYGEVTSLGKAPIIEIREQIFDVSIFYLNDILENLNKEKKPDEEELKNKFGFEKTLPQLDERLFEPALKIIEKIEFTNVPKSKSILVFLPGVREIESFRDFIIQNYRNYKESLDILILHSKITDEEQGLIFKSSNNRKIILATNIAESSITIKNNDYIIDFCLIKVITFDKLSNDNCLELNWASKASCDQRAGRTGRVSKGYVFRMVFNSFYKDLEPFPTPEITRMPLEKIILKIKIYNRGEPEDVLKQAITPPNIEYLKLGISKLQLLGALTLKNAISPTGQLTEWGSIFSDLPLEIKYCRLIMLSFAFNMIEPGIVLAAILSQDKKLFKIKGMSQYDLLKLKKYFDMGDNCDFIAIYRAFKMWEKKYGFKLQSNEVDTHISRKRFSPSEINSEREMINNYLMDKEVLTESLRVISDLKRRLIKRKVYETSSNVKFEFDSKDKIELFKYIIGGTFYENIFKAFLDNEERIIEFNAFPFQRSLKDTEELRRTLIFKGLEKIGDRDIKSFIESIQSLINEEEENKAEDNKIVKYNKLLDNDLEITFSSLKPIQKLLFFFPSKASINKQALYDKNGKKHIFKIVSYEFSTNLISCFRSAKVEIEQDSINNVIVEEENENIKQCRYVTDEINDRHTKLLARCVTKLPTKPMITQMLLLIFSPKCQFICDPKNYKYTGFTVAGSSQQFDFNSIFSTVDILDINEIRDQMNQIFNFKLDGSESVSEFNILTQKLKGKLEKLLNKERINAIHKPELLQLLKEYYSKGLTQPKYIKTPKRLQHQKYYILSPKRSEDYQRELINYEVLPLLVSLDINEDYRLFTEEGKRNLQIENDLYKSLPKRITEDLNLIERIINQESAEIFCGDCDSYICSINNVTVEQFGENQKLIRFGGWVSRNLFTISSDAPSIQKNRFVLENKATDLTPDKYILCYSKNHVIGIYYNNYYYGTTYSNLRIKTLMQKFEVLSPMMWENNFSDVKEQIEKEKNIKENFIKNSLICKLCGPYRTNNIDEFNKHIKSQQHVLLFQKMLEDIE